MCTILFTLIVNQLITTVKNTIADVLACSVLESTRAWSFFIFMEKKVLMKCLFSLVPLCSWTRIVLRLSYLFHTYRGARLQQLHLETILSLHSPDIQFHSARDGQFSKLLHNYLVIF